MFGAWLKFAAIFQPTDRAHLARFILPSSVARLPAPNSRAAGFQEREAACAKMHLQSLRLDPHMIDARDRSAGELFRCEKPADELGR